MPGTGGYALLVEDDPDVGALLCHHLGALGYDVCHLTSAEDALAHLQQETDGPTPDLAVVDIVLPGLDGRVVVRALEDARHAGCRVVVTSVVDRDDLGVEVDAVLPKPFRRQDLVRALEHAGAGNAGGGGLSRGPR